MKNNFKKAFSLFEISIAILIVGILTAAISKGVDLAYDMRLATARSLTDKAPMYGIDNLELWLETTSKESLATGTASFVNVENPADKQAIGRWNDLNPTTLNSSDLNPVTFNPIYKNPALQPTLASQPLYMKDGINGLPALWFDGANDHIASKNNFSIINNFTVFIVGFPQASCIKNTVGNVGTSNQKYIFYPQHGDVVYVNNNAAGAGVSLCENFIAPVEHTSNYMPYVIQNSRVIKKPIQFTLKYSNRKPTLYLNSTESYSGNASTKNVFPSLTFAGNIIVGDNYGYFKGFIGEIIVYSTDLSDTDRKLIETYLIEKWRIKP